MEEYEAAGIPWSHLIAYIGPTNKPENKELYNLLHAKGVMCMLSAAPGYDKLNDADARRAAYEETIKAGADIIESDLPIEAAKAIAPLVPAQSPKQKFFGKTAIGKGA